VRQHDKAQRQHPEAEDGQKPQEATDNQQQSDANPRHARAWQRDAPRAKNELAGRMIDAKVLGARISSVVFPVSHPQEMGLSEAIASRCHFFEKTAWQIGQAFVLAHSHRAKQ
jgi:hypothetical protein